MSSYVITGASRGLGFEFVRQILQKTGTRVFACCRDPSSATSLVELMNSSAKRLSIHQLDVTNEKSIESAAKEISKLTSNGIDVLINNAGIEVGPGRPSKIKKEDLEKMFATNVTGPILVIQQFTTLLEQGNKRQIINISSNLGSIALQEDMLELIGYGMTKAALNMATTGFAAELKEKKIMVISMHPGWVQTDMGGKDAEITPEKSIASMLKVIDDLSLADTGRFLSYDGSSLPW